MPALSTLTTFVAVVAAFAALPGPSNLYVVAQGLRSGRGPALAAAAGCALGALTYVAATTLGLAALLASSATALSVLHYAGGAYLLVLAVRSWRGAGHARAATTTPASAARALRGGYLAELSNPKVALFFLAFFPQFVHPDRGAPWAQLLVLGVAFCLVGLASDSLYAVASGTVRRRLAGRPRRGAAGDRLGALLYAALGGWAIWSGTRAHAR